MFSFFFFVFLSLQVLLAFHSVRTIPFPQTHPTPLFVEFLVDRHKVDESDSSISRMTRARTGRPVKQGSILVEDIDIALRHYIRVTPDRYGALS